MFRLCCFIPKKSVVQMQEWQETRFQVLLPFLKQFILNIFSYATGISLLIFLLPINA